MKKRNLSFTKSAWALGLMLLAVFIGAPSYGAVVDVYLQVGVTTIPAASYYPVSATYPLGIPSENITMWGYAQCTDGTFNTCGPVAVPGPVLTATEGDTLNIHLKNNLTAVIISGLTPPASLPMYTEPTSVIINGQIPVLVAGSWPTWTNGSTGNRPVGDTTLRVRSFTTETPIGGVSTYTWGPLKPGTNLYESGTHPAVQVQMGLYGALIVYPTGSLGPGQPGQAYDDPSTAYSSEVPLLFSEIDPELHYSVASGWYGTPPPAPPGVPLRGQRTSTVDYHPKFFLINGRPYSSVNMPPVITSFNPNGVTPAPLITTTQKTLLRFLNAGLLEKTPTFINQYMNLIAEDSNLFTYSNNGVTTPYSKQQYGFLLPAGKTMDVLWQPAVLGTGPTATYNQALFDRSLNVTNASVSPGGMLVYLSVVQ